jgi:Tol biopolymer transport system component
MRNTLLLLLSLFLLAMLFACGGGSSSVTPIKAQTQTFAFIREVPNTPNFQPVIGKLTNGNYSETVVNTQVPLRSVILSPDGKLGAFDMPNAQGQTDIYIANADGTGSPTALTNDAFGDGYPGFSPDGKKVIFVSDRGNVMPMTTMTVNLDGTGLTDIMPNNTVCTHQAAFSPDGKHIAVAGHDNTNLDIWIMNADGTNPVNLTMSTNGLTANLFPAFSPDGKQIAFTHLDAIFAAIDVYIMNVDGSNSHKISNFGYDWYPRFLGNTITFNSFRDGNAEIYSMNTDGTSVKRLTNNTVYDSFSSDLLTRGAVVTVDMFRDHR